MGGIYDYDDDDDWFTVQKFSMQDLALLTLGHGEAEHYGSGGVVAEIVRHVVDRNQGEARGQGPRIIF